MTADQHVDDLILSQADFALAADEDDSSTTLDVHGQQRFLQIQAVPCPGGGPIKLSSLSEIKFVPQGGFNTNQCTSAKRQQLGAENQYTSEKLRGRTVGCGDNAAYLAKYVQ
jgi:hypothetical protein